MERVLLLSLTAAIAPSSLGAGRVLYSQPHILDISNASIVRVNPTVTVLGQTVVDFWRVGTLPLAPVNWPLSDYTGTYAAENATRGLLPAMPASSAMSFTSGIFGAVLNTSVDAIEPAQTLGTITLEQSWDLATAVAPWAASGSLDCIVEYQVPWALRAAGGVAVYSSWSLGIFSAVDATFIWYETAIFDLDRPLGGDQLYYDTVSHNVIVHGVLGVPSDFHTAAPDSAKAQSNVWAGWRTLHFTVSSSQLSAAIRQVNEKFKLSLHADASLWQLVHFNVELEGTANVSAAHALRGLTITALPA
jgi:hypothetical protein